MSDIHLCDLPDERREGQPSWLGLERLASSQAGYFTAAQARRLGFSASLIGHHFAAGRFVRPRRALYRFASAVTHPHEELIDAWLWSAGSGTFSHATALHLHGLLGVPPLFVQLTVPPTWRSMHRRRPRRTALHFATVEIEEREIVHGLPVTAVPRALRDAALSLRDRRLLHRALRCALERELIDLPSAEACLARFRA